MHYPALYGSSSSKADWQLTLITARECMSRCCVLFFSVTKFSPAFPGFGMHNSMKCATEWESYVNNSLVSSRSLSLALPLQTAPSSSQMIDYFLKRNANILSKHADSDWNSTRVSFPAQLNRMVGISARGWQRCVWIEEVSLLIIVFFSVKFVLPHHVTWEVEIERVRESESIE